MKLTSAEPVPAHLAAQYESATATGHYRRWPTRVFCSCGDVCEFCAPEPAKVSRRRDESNAFATAPTPGRLRRLCACLTRRDSSAQD